MGLINSNKKGLLSGFVINNPISFRNVNVEQNRDAKGRFAKGFSAISEPTIADKFVNSRKEKTFGVSSTAIERARYDPSDNSLNITYKGGDKEYKFDAKDDLQEWVDALSKGRITQEWRATHRMAGY